MSAGHRRGDGPYGAAGTGSAGGAGSSTGSGGPVEVRVPGDKSITHRALLFAAIAEGTSQLSGLLDAADTRSTAGALRALGVAAPDGALDTATIHGVGLRGLRDPGGTLDCGNSGTTSRLLLGLLAGAGVTATLDGDASLRKRPMRRITEPLSAVGAAYDEVGEPGRLPIRVRPGRPLRPIDHDNHRSSAQVKTAMLLAGLLAGVPVTVREPGRSRDHTERMLRAQGVDLQQEEDDDVLIVRLRPAHGLEPLTMRVPGDISSAAFFLGLGALRGAVRVRGVGLNPTRTGALAVLERMGARVTVSDRGVEGGEDVGSVTASPGDTLAGTTVTAEEMPTLLDEVPLLAAVAARATGTTRFEGVAELRVKESDRVDAMVKNLRGLGIECREGDTWFEVDGRPARPLRGTADSFDDHRVAMAFAVLGALPGSDIRVRGMEAVAISFPTFEDELAKANAALESA